MSLSRSLGLPMLTFYGRGMILGAGITGACRVLIAFTGINIIGIRQIGLPIEIFFSIWPF